MIQICDAIMGSGKSSAAINYMNSHPDKKFIYVTPYLDEAARIREACPNLSFQEPSDKIPAYHFRKSEHTAALIASGRNIASTHKMFLGYTPEMIEQLRSHHYTLIIDEDMDVIEECVTMTTGDLRVLSMIGAAEVDGDRITLTQPDWYDGFYNPLFSMAKCRTLTVARPDQKDSALTGEIYYWIYSHEILEAFEDVFVLTYLFAGQTMRWYLELEGFTFSHINVDFDGNTYSFTDGPGHTPDYIKNIKDKVHVVDAGKINEIGDQKNALSSTWFSKRAGDSVSMDKLRKNLLNFFTNYSDAPAGQRMWTTFESSRDKIKEKRYSRSFTAFNLRATNNFRNRTSLAYCVNVFMNPYEKRYLTEHGVDPHEDEYALSCMVQWVWRSAIRDGGEIQLYCPSRRMRELFTDWMESLWEGGEA